MVESSHARLRELQMASRAQGGLVGVGAAALEELATALEELRATTEDLRVQNQELSDALAELGSERERYHALFQQVPDAYVITDDRGIIIDLNPVAAALFGSTVGRIRRKSIVTFMPDVLQRLHTLEATPGTPATWEMGVQSRARGMVPVEVRVARGQPPYGDGIRWLLRDLSDRQRAEERTRWLVQEQSSRHAAERGERDARFLAAISHALITEQDIEVALAGLTRAVADFAADLCIVELRPGTRPPRRYVHHRSQPRRATVLARGSIDPAGDSDAALVLRTGESRLVTGAADAQELRLPEAEAALAWELGVRSCAVLPVRTAGVVVGLLIAGAAESLDARLLLLHEIADRLALAVERARLQALADTARSELELRVAERTAELAGANARLAEEVRERHRAERARTRLLRELSIAQEEERRRISRELHDELGQLATGLHLGLKGLQRTVAHEPELARRVASLQAIAERIGRGTHHIAQALRPPELDNLGLRIALANYLEEWAQRHGIACDFHALGPESPRLRGDLEITLYRVVQEGLTNVLRHARATRVSLLLERRAGQAAIILEDDGVGFDADPLEAEGSTDRLGLRGMRERIAMLGGTLTIQSAPGSGTTIFARVPEYTGTAP